VNNKRLLRVSREAGWVAAGQIAAFLGGFAAIKILTSQLGPDAYGQLALGVSIAGALHMFLYGPIEQMAIRFVSVYRERNELGLLFRVLGKFHFYAAIIVAFGAACAIVAITATSGEGWGLLVFSALILGLAGGINTTLSSLQSAFRNRATVALFQASDVWMRLLLACAGLAYFFPSANIALTGFCLATAATAAAQAVWIWRNPPVSADMLKQGASGPEPERRAMSELTAYGRPYIAFAAFAWLSTYGDRWFILSQLDERTVGIYTALFQIANAPIALFIGCTNLFLVPLIFDRAGAATTGEQVRASARLLNGALAGYVVALIAISAAAAAFAKPLVLLMTNEVFAEHSDLLWILCLGLSLSGTGQLLVVKGLSQGRSQDYIMPKFIQLALLLAGLLLMIRPLGLTGVALALCLSGAGYLVAVALVNRRFRAPLS